MMQEAVKSYSQPFRRIGILGNLKNIFGVIRAPYLTREICNVILQNKRLIFKENLQRKRLETGRRKISWKNQQ
ncbi:MAG TPA: hypothetical protein VEH58_03065 [Dehalococcoidales bacterium]|nr:hypothetical protein [Dehalococcoidales bacterium]